MSEVRVLCRPEVGAGFALAGLHTINAATPAEAADRLAELGNRPGAGVILLEEALYRSLPEELRHRFSKRPLPMIVPFPGPEWAARAEEAETYIVELLRQVVGYRVRLK